MTCPGGERFQAAKNDREDDTDLDAFVALEIEKEQILAQAEQERFQIKESRGEEEIPQAPSPQEEESFLEQSEFAHGEELPAPQESPGRKSLPLLLGGGILVILVAAVLGYFFFSPLEKPAKPKKIKVAATKTKTKPVKFSAPIKQSGSEKENPKKKADLVPADKREPPEPVKTVEGVAIRKSESSGPSSETKKPSEPADILPAPPAKPAATKPGSANLTPKSPQPAEAVTTSKKPLAEEPEPFSPPLPSSKDKGPYSVHVASFREQNNAFLLRDKLKAKGYPAFCNFVKLDEKGDWYRVQIGYFNNREDVKQAESTLKREEKIDTRILHYNLY